jgi:hypothetical protein
VLFGVGLKLWLGGVLEELSGHQLTVNAGINTVIYLEKFCWNIWMNGMRDREYNMDTNDTSHNQ